MPGVHGANVLFGIILVNVFATALVGGKIHAIASLVNLRLGEVATSLRLADRTIPVRVRLPDNVRFDPKKRIVQLGGQRQKRSGAKRHRGPERLVELAEQHARRQHRNVVVFNVAGSAGKGKVEGLLARRS